MTRQISIETFVLGPRDLNDQRISEVPSQRALPRIIYLDSAFIRFLFLSRLALPCTGIENETYEMFEGIRGDRTLEIICANDVTCDSV